MLMGLQEPYKMSWEVQSLQMLLKEVRKNPTQNPKKRMNKPSRQTMNLRTENIILWITLYETNHYLCLQARFIVLMVY